MMPMDVGLWSLILVLAIVLGLAKAVITAAVRCRWNQWHSADSKYEPCEDNDLAPDLIDLIADLEDLGFVIRGYWQFLGQSHATAQLTLLEHPQTLDVAKVMIAEAGVRRQVTVLFQTRFSDGTEIATSNARLTVGLPPLPEITHLWLSEVRDAKRLYRVHVQARDYLELGKKRIPIGPDPVAFLTVGRDRVFAHWVKTGYYFLDETHGVYRPTWKGAFLMTWRLSHPVRPFYRAWRSRPTRRHLRDLGIRVDP